MDKKIKDEDIRDVLDSVNFDIPFEIDKKVNEIIYSKSIHSGFLRRVFRTSNPIIKWLPAFASVLLIMFLGLVQLSRDVPEREPLSEIRIEYELKDKNIKIIWVKRENFLLRRQEK